MNPTYKRILDRAELSPREGLKAAIIRGRVRVRKITYRYPVEEEIESILRFLKSRLEPDAVG